MPKKKGLTPLDNKSNNKKSYLTGLTLLEILVSTTILVMVIGGLASVFVAAKAHILHSRSRVTAAEAIKWYLEPLQTEVSEKERLKSPPTKCLWNIGNCSTTEWEDSISQITYTPKTWKIEEVTGTSLRKVKLTLEWNERTAQ